MAVPLLADPPVAPAISDAFEREMVAAIPRLRRYVSTLCRDRAQAEDLLQEALLRAWSARERYAVGTNFIGWIFTIARNLFLSGRRRAWRELAYDQAALAKLKVTPADQVQVLMLNETRNAMSVLTEAQRRAIYLVGVGGYSHGEAAELCGAAEGTIKSRLNRGKAKLQAAIRSGAFQRDGKSAQDAFDMILVDMTRASGPTSPSTSRP